MKKQLGLYEHCIGQRNTLGQEDLNTGCHCGSRQIWSHISVVSNFSIYWECSKNNHVSPGISSDLTKNSFAILNFSSLKCLLDKFWTVYLPQMKFHLQLLIQRTVFTNAKTIVPYSFSCCFFIVVILVNLKIELFYEVNISLISSSHYWDSETGENNSFLGKGHTNQVSRMAVDEWDQLVSCSMDDTVRYTSLSTKDYR